MPHSNIKAQLSSILSQDLDFAGADTGYGPHDLHAFPAKFPPQLPRLFIDQLTERGDTVLDPMVGSGTTLVESCLAGRHSIGFDVDPLSLLINRVKVTQLAPAHVQEVGAQVLARAHESLVHPNGKSGKSINPGRDAATQRFIDYWFAAETQRALDALWTAIKEVGCEPVRHFLALTFSGIIITKSGGVSLAFDLAHSRPHLAKVVKTSSGEVLLGHDSAESNTPRVRLLTKTLRDPLEEFGNALNENIASLSSLRWPHRTQVDVCYADAQCLPLRPNSADLVVTSPPYAANAIDYMRAHRFSLVWMGHSVDQLSIRRKSYIGGEAVVGFPFEPLPKRAAEIVTSVEQRDQNRGRVIHRYYSEMTRVLREMHRVLRPGKAAVLVVGTSVTRGIDIEVGPCLTEIGQSIGFELVEMAKRRLDRNRRMLPVSNGKKSEDQIQQRMHNEVVIGFVKPA